MTKLTSKQAVLAQYPTAVYKPNPDGNGGYIYFASKELVGSVPRESGVLGEGSNANQAWNNAAKYIEGTTAMPPNVEVKPEYREDLNTRVSLQTDTAVQLRQVAPNFTMTGTQEQADELKARLATQQAQEQPSDEPEVAEPVSDNVTRPTAEEHDLNRRTPGHGFMLPPPATALTVPLPGVVERLDKTVTITNARPYGARRELTRKEREKKAAKRKLAAKSRAKNRRRCG